MNGTMIISSDYGIGTKYKLIIDERIVNTTNPETNKYLKDYENKKILVIDDNKQTGLIFTKYLKNNHIAIDTAYTGRETLNKIKDKNKYDLIIVDSSDPFGPSEGLFTREFYGNCYNALKADGIMVNQQGSPFYSEDAHAMQRSHKRIASTFQISRVYQAHIPTFAAGYWLFGFASKKYHPVDDLDPEAWNALNLRTRYYTTRLHRGAFYLPAFLEEMLQEVED